MPPDWDPKSPALLPTIICYADILGFRGMTEHAHELGEETEFLQRIKRSLASAYKIVRRARTLDGAVASCQWRRHVGPLGRSKTVPPGVFMFSEKVRANWPA